MQYLVYTVTVAVCTRTGPQELQILKKFSETVYASPNRRQMDSKGKSDEVVYPNLVFNVDNYEQVFSDCVIRDSECLCVELTAYDLSGQMRGVCFLGTIQYESVKKFYSSKHSNPIQRPERLGLLTRRFGSMSGRANLCSLGTLPQQTPAAVKFMRMLGPQAQGLAEFAVCAVEPDNPDERIAFCRCGNRLGLFGPVCCVCGSSTGRLFEELTDHVQPSQPEASSKVEFELDSPVTQQPTKFSGLSNADFDAWSDFNGCGIPELSSKSGSNTSLHHIVTLHSIPSSAKSAGASAETSPVRRWGSIRRGPMHLRDRTGEVPDVNTVGGSRWVRNNGLHPRHKPRGGSKVSEILDRFTRTGTTCEQSDTTQPAARHVDMPNATQKNVIVNPSGVLSSQTMLEQNGISGQSRSISEGASW
ncbi:Proteasome alpha subunit [Fasciolopsis buskii]|uniref:Proteasome alpha subunit n=1 Tax=Fasciolopsis buskii TaxID=27845 RepID=A0A8E0VNV0_9TREM|nr:Proteasome alpha subunit [Fasciolopsis buski]